MREWNRLIASPAAKVEAILQSFLEQHPCLLPGLHSPWPYWSGRSPFPWAAISKPKLPGLSDREPDFMWIAMDSERLYPILIEIETPFKEWFYGSRAEIHSNFTHAQGQLAEWRAWFDRGHNRSAFIDYYGVPTDVARLKLDPRFVLIYGRRSNYEGDRRRQAKRAELAHTGHPAPRRRAEGSSVRTTDVLAGRAGCSYVLSRTGSRVGVLVRVDGPRPWQAFQPRCARLRRFRVDPPTSSAGWAGTTRAAGCDHDLVDLAHQVALEAADDLGLGKPFGGAAVEVVAGARGHSASGKARRCRGRCSRRGHRRG